MALMPRLLRVKHTPLSLLQVRFEGPWSVAITIEPPNAGPIQRE